MVDKAVAGFLSFKLESIFLEKSERSAVEVATVSGHDCQFVNQPPKRSECPICLLILRMPHQATCCGKIFCKTCICKVMDMKQPCPTCKTESFACYPDKGLQQELYSCNVYCPKRSEGCSWVGELRTLDQHLNYLEKAKNVRVCRYIKVDCPYCSVSYQRCDLDRHQSTECVKRPFTCEMCLEYKSTYLDVVFLHLPMCKCRPVDCPNKCGGAVQYQELEEHLSIHCELSEVDCEFSHAGCEAKMHRKDLSVHLSHNMATHMALLVTENRRLKLELEHMKAKLWIQNGKK